MNFKLSCTRIFVIAIVLGLVAKTISPKPAEAVVQENFSELIDSLIQMRTNLDLYRAQHKGLLPPTDCFDNFESAMTKQIGSFGPYIREIPVNPCNGQKTIRFDGEEAGVNEAGWRLDTETGLFQADNNTANAAL